MGICFLAVPWICNLSFFQFIICLDRGVTGIFFWGGKVIFPDFFPGVKCFFPVENSHFGRPKTNFRRFQKWKAKKKKKKKKKKLYNVFLLQFSVFHLFFSIFTPFPFFSLASFFPIRQQKFPRQKSRGGALPPCPRLLRHCVSITNLLESLNLKWCNSIYR